MVLVTGKKMIIIQKHEFVPGLKHSSLPGNVHYRLLV